MESARNMFLVSCTLALACSGSGNDGGPLGRRHIRRRAHDVMHGHGLLRRGRPGRMKGDNMRTLLLAMTVLAAAETIVHAQDCTTVPADETVSLSYQPYAGYSAWAQSPKSYGHPGCDRFVVDIVGNRDRTIWAGATVDIPEAAAQCTLTVVKETIWGWVPPVCWKMGSCFPGYWVQVADKSASGDEPATSAVCSISAGDGFSSQYDTIRIAAIAEQRDLFDSGYSKVGPVDVTDLAE